jgi:hypothetical protein
LQGVAAELRRMCSRDEASDDVVAARVRATLGRYVSHPRSISVVVHDGRVTVAGPVLAQEVTGFLKAILSVRGVKDVNDRLDVHSEAGDISGLQGGRPPAGEPSEWSQAIGRRPCGWLRASEGRRFLVMPAGSNSRWRAFWARWVWPLWPAR